MLSSPAAETKEAPLLTPADTCKVKEIPWQRMVSLLRTVMGAPVALLLKDTTVGPKVAVISPQSAQGFTPDTSTRINSASALSSSEPHGPKQHQVSDQPGFPGPAKILGEPLFNPDGSLYGTLCLLDQTPDPFPNPELLSEFARTMETHLCLAETRQALTRESKKRVEEAATDPLTGLLNRHSFPQRFHEEVARHKRAKRPLSIIICDLDRFKELNDTQGRAAGDTLLVDLATRFKGRLRAHDLIWRWGGDAFLLLLPETPIMGAVEVVESMRRLVEEKVQPKETKHRITLSAGVTNFNSSESGDACLNRCNKLLKAAKEKGRNCVILG